ncbi:hypothetical protein [Macrococcoides caseolyticum]|uniref:DUF4868 domain-containing protein n=1 Tax=Macrococcoides caseolyticum TaxID=69966 RepID=A0A855GPY3_9STAP|nr:hypothetical protein [Macrococcus caseolyticus]PKE27170.1 hypothetical protein CW686_01620 [Macrococcus caseolyticus]PKE59607.1 hypothetical protein CW673_01320 [Macrococcus caseolyticus]PKE71160.1 hypothetical protein CW662_01285 [Macrococcus caseolyticus]
MLLNNGKSVIRKFLNDKNIQLELYLLRHTDNMDCTIEAKEAELEKEVTSFLIKNLKKNLNKLMVEDKFNVAKYNSEFQVHDKLATFKAEAIAEVNDKFKEMKKAIELNELEIKNAKFQLVKLIDTEQQNACYIGYYQGSKKAASNKRLIIEKEKFKLLNENVISIGGKIDFMIDEEDNIYVSNALNFEHAFKYIDHIYTKRDQNIKLIVEQSLFGDDNSQNLFSDEANKYIRSRSIAQMSDETITNLKNHFDSRCEDLKIIKKELEDNPDSKDELSKKYGIILELLNYIDLENKKIIITKEYESKLSPIFHLFQNKIVESYLTGEVRTAVGYQE